MARVLSQVEIDALLTALGGTEKESAAKSEEVEAYGALGKAAGVYDFRHPERLSRDQMRVLETVHQSFARSTGAFLSSRLMMLTEMTVVKAHQVTYAEFIASTTEPYCIYVFTLRTREEEAILSFNPDLTFFIVDRMFGGQGRVSESPREITAIEQNMMDKIVNTMLDHLTRAWHGICPLTPVSKAFHTNPSIVQIAPAGELMVTISFNIKIHDFSTGLSLCLPVPFLEETLPKQRRRYQNPFQRISEKDLALMKRKLWEIDIPVVVRLGEVRMSFRDLADLRPGDIIRLDQKSEDEVHVLAGDKVRFYGLPGIIGDRKGIQIVRPASPEEKTALSEEEKNAAES